MRRPVASVCCGHTWLPVAWVLLSCALALAAAAPDAAPGASRQLTQASRGAGLNKPAAGPPVSTSGRRTGGAWEWRTVRPLRCNAQESGPGCAPKTQAKRRSAPAPTESEVLRVPIDRWGVWAVPRTSSQMLQRPKPAAKVPPQSSPKVTRTPARNPAPQLIATPQTKPAPAPQPTGNTRRGPIPRPQPRQALQPRPAMQLRQLPGLNLQPVPKAKLLLPPQTQLQPLGPPAAQPGLGLQGGVESVPPARTCIATTSSKVFRVLAVGDSTTAGSVPSKDKNAPYTNRLQQLLPGRLKGVRLQVDNAGLGGAGVLAKAKGQTVLDAAEAYLQRQPYDVVVVMAGINDVIAERRPATDAIKVLSTFYRRVLQTGASVVAIPPLAAPGEANRGDKREVQRRQLSDLIAAYANAWQRRTRGKGPQLYFLNAELRGFDFFSMSDAERLRYLDDGLHLTEVGYARLGEFVADSITQRLC